MIVYVVEFVHFSGRKTRKKETRHLPNPANAEGCGAAVAAGAPNVGVLVVGWLDAVVVGVENPNPELLPNEPPPNILLQNRIFPWKTQSDAVEGDFLGDTDTLMENFDDGQKVDGVYYPRRTPRKKNRRKSTTNRCFFSSKKQSRIRLGVT